MSDADLFMELAERATNMQAGSVAELRAIVHCLARECARVAEDAAREKTSAISEKVCTSPQDCPPVSKSVNHTAKAPPATPPSETVTPVCSTCRDTHWMSRSGGKDNVMCTHCPTPCQRCRAGGNGPYCEHTPCSCDCHRKPSETVTEGASELPERIRVWPALKDPTTFGWAKAPSDETLPVGVRTMEYVRADLGSALAADMERSRSANLIASIRQVESERDKQRERAEKAEAERADTQRLYVACANEVDTARAEVERLKAERASQAEAFGETAKSLAGDCSEHQAAAGRAGFRRGIEKAAKACDAWALELHDHETCASESAVQTAAERIRALGAKELGG